MLTPEQWDAVEIALQMHSVMLYERHDWDGHIAEQAAAISDTLAAVREARQSIIVNDRKIADDLAVYLAMAHFRIQELQQCLDEIRRAVERSHQPERAWEVIGDELIQWERKLEEGGDGIPERFRTILANVKHTSAVLKGSLEEGERE